MWQVQLSDRQSSFIFYLVHQGKGRTEAARLAGFAAPRQSAFTLTQSPKIIAKIRQERNKVYQTELASTAVQTLKEVMEDTDAPLLVQGLLLPGRLWSLLETLVSIHSPNETMSRILLKWHRQNCLLLLTDGKEKKRQLQRILHLSDKGICSIFSVIVHIKTRFFIPY